MPRAPKDELKILAVLSRSQLLRAQALGRSLDERAKTKRAVALDWIPDEDFRRDFAAVNQAIQHSGASLIRALEGTQKNMGNLTEEQIEAQFDTELVRSAAALSDDQWDAMVAARASAKKNK